MDTKSLYVSDFDKEWCDVIRYETRSKTFITDNSVITLHYLSELSLPLKSYIFKSSKQVYSSC